MAQTKLSGHSHREIVLQRPVRHLEQGEGSKKKLAAQQRSFAGTSLKTTLLDAAGATWLHSGIHLFVSGFGTKMPVSE